MRAGRTCYDHLAGRLGVAVADGLVRAEVSAAGRSRASRRRRRGGRTCRVLDIDIGAARAHEAADVARLPRLERAAPAPRRGLGAALLGRLEAIGGIERLAPGRAVRLMPAGHELLGWLGVSLGAA